MCDPKNKCSPILNFNTKRVLGNFKALRLPQGDRLFLRGMLLPIRDECTSDLYFDHAQLAPISMQMVESTGLLYAKNAFSSLSSLSFPPRSLNFSRELRNLGIFKIAEKIMTFFVFSFWRN